MKIMEFKYKWYHIEKSWTNPDNEEEYCLCDDWEREKDLDNVEWEFFGSLTDCKTYIDFIS